MSFSRSGRKIVSGQYRREVFIVHGSLSPGSVWGSETLHPISVCEEGRFSLLDFLKRPFMVPEVEIVSNPFSVTKILKESMVCPSAFNTTCPPSALIILALNGNSLSGSWMLSPSSFTSRYRLLYLCNLIRNQRLLCKIDALYSLKERAVA